MASTIGGGIISLSPLVSRDSMVLLVVVITSVMVDSSTENCIAPFDAGVNCEEDGVNAGKDADAVIIGAFIAVVADLADAEITDDLADAEITVEGEVGDWADADLPTLKIGSSDKKV